MPYTVYYLMTPREAVSVLRRPTQFYYDAVVKTLYRHSYASILLCRLSNSEAQEVIKEAHDDICGAHQSGPKFKNRLHRLGYYWSTMIADALEYAKKCKACQMHADFIHQPSKLLHPTFAAWPFEARRIDIIGPISPPSAKDYRFILTITDYFLKWAEAILLVEVKTTNMVNFIKHHVIHRFGVPR